MTMRAVVLSQPGPVSNLQLQSLPIPEPTEGWIRIRVRAAGMNRSELHTRLGLAGDSVQMPRVLGIETVGTVDLDPSGTFTTETQVATMMGGMGRTFDGGYAEYTCVPVNQVIPFTSELPWEVLGAVPEMLQTSYGTLSVGLDAQPGQSILIRGGTSSIGMTIAVLAKLMNMTVISTTRDKTKGDRLRELGVDHIIIDDGNVAEQVREIYPEGVDAAVELVGTPTLRDTLLATRMHGTVCFTGMLSNQWTVKDFYPIDYLPRGVRLSAYSGESRDLPATVLQRFLDQVAAGSATVPLDRTFELSEVQDAHALMESDKACGKLVLLP
ncbi:zinc-binding alcohol dehydrogenase family protein [Glutamicibacter sp. M10]|uniref:zinc-binding alcohol dehydrogenase family protein n=1 Tax=Glutamicibacter sp. M10 TaxID=3023076 RepID=UPI0021C9128A|nr:zinc-binding alcohol dehydrogenase family protein [Glutamicibacter sp. M10]UXN32759.1 zinc-binding alcohol dehydrogenase family protein [Glutamicibacter sp. M10]